MSIQYLAASIIECYHRIIRFVINYGFLFQLALDSCKGFHFKILNINADTIYGLKMALIGQ